MFLKFFSIVLLIVLILTSRTSAQENYVRGELLVNLTDQGKSITLTNSKLTHNTGLNSIDDLNIKYNCYEMKKVYLGPAPPAKGLYLLKFDENSNILNISKEYQKDSNVKNVSLNYILEVTETPDDYYFDEQWNHDNSHLQSELAWNYETGSDEIIISINDTGIDYLHPDLQNNIWVNPGEDLDNDGVVGDFGIPANGGDENGIDDDNNGYVDDLIGWDFRYSDNDPQHSSGSHGTWVAGMAAAEGDNTIGVAGVSWNSKLMATRVGYDIWINYNAAVAGIYYAADNGVDVINFSWRGNGTTSGDLQTALDYAYDDTDVVLVAAAANDSDSLRNYPAEYSKVIGVAALHENDTKRWNSCWGSWIDVSAPGHLLWSTDYDYSDGSHTYAQVGATSIASPQVAGLAALIKSVSPNLENQMIRNIITSTADNIDDVNPSYVGLLGTGRINARAALQYVSAPATPQNFQVTTYTGIYPYRPKLTWTANSEPDLTGYRIERKINNGSWSPPNFGGDNVAPDETEFIDMEILIWNSNNSQTVYYRMQAFDIEELYSSYTQVKSIDFRIMFKPEANSQPQEDISLKVPLEFELNQNYPNPFNPETQIRFGLPEDSKVTIEVFNLQGRKVATLANGYYEAGYHSVTFSGANHPSGVYFYRTVSGDFQDIKRMLLIK